MEYLIATTATGNTAEQVFRASVQPGSYRISTPLRQVVYIVNLV